MAYVLFTDLVGYSMMPMDQQTHVIQLLQEIVRATPEFQRAHANEQLICLPTGDGMALVFFQNPVAAVQCAVEVARALRSHPEMKLRMGVHTGPVHRIPDINTNRNVSGGGINLAQRVMDCGDAGHILVSKSVADILSQLSDWALCLHDLGEHEVKHGVKVHLVNLHTPEAGNAEIPQKLRRRVEVPPGPQPRPAKSHRGIYMLAGAALTIAILIFAGTQVANWRRADANAKGASEPASPEVKALGTTPPANSEPERELFAEAAGNQSATQTPSAAPVETAAVSQPKSAGRPAQDSILGAKGTPGGLDVLRDIAQAQTPVGGTVSPLVAAAPPQPSTAAAAPQPSAAEAELEELQDRFLKLSARANVTKNAVDRLRQQQARSGLGLRGDMAAALERQEFLLSQADSALTARDPARMKRQLDLAEREVEKLERFLGM
jgi:class 3 adenylate cyclase